MSKKRKSRNVKGDESFRKCLPPPALQTSYSPPLTIETLLDKAVYVAYNVLSKEECQAWIEYCRDDLEYTQLTASRYTAHRECFRWQQTDETLAEQLYQRILPLLRKMDFGLSEMLVGCNENLRLYRYDKGMSFGKHVDDSNSAQHGTTKVTVLIYLSTCRGGATRFYTTSAKKSFAFEPSARALLCHVHGDRCLEHEADPVLDGVKYVLRTDLVYKRR